jgi:arylsulfatase A-like enzyme
MSSQVGVARELWPWRERMIDKTLQEELIPSKDTDRRRRRDKDHQSRKKRIFMETPSTMKQHQKVPMLCCRKQCPKPSNAFTEKHPLRTREPFDDAIRQSKMWLPNHQPREALWSSPS